MQTSESQVGQMNENELEIMKNSSTVIIWKAAECVTCYVYSFVDSAFTDFQLLARHYARF